MKIGRLHPGCLTGCQDCLSFLASLEWPALIDLRDEFSPLITKCSGVMARLVWARNQPMISRCIIACLDRMSC